MPLSFDLGIVLLSLKVVTAARQGRHALTLRAMIAARSAVTVAVNGAASHDLAGQLLHAVPPAMFVICCEPVIATARRHGLTQQSVTPACQRLPFHEARRVLARICRAG